MRKLLFASASLFAISGFMPGVASAQDGLVSVNIQDVLQDIAVELNIEETSIPVNVQLPVNVAANVCDVEVSALSAEIDSGTATCAAVTGSQELTQVVQQQVASGGSNEDNDETASDDGSGSTDDDGNATDEDVAGSDDDAATDDDDMASDDDGAQDETQTGSVNSAKKFAPSQSDRKAPGLTDDPQANAPGQLKKACPEGETCE